MDKCEVHVSGLHTHHSKELGCSFCGVRQRTENAISHLGELRTRVTEALDRFYPHITCAVERCRARDWILHQIRRKFLEPHSLQGNQAEKRARRLRIISDNVNAYKHSQINFSTGLDLQTNKGRQDSKDHLHLSFNGDRHFHVRQPNESLPNQLLAPRTYPSYYVRMPSQADPQESLLVMFYQLSTQEYS